MMFSTNSSNINVVASALLLESLCVKAAFQPSGPQYLVFESDDASRTKRLLEISSNSWIEYNNCRLEVCDEKHDFVVRHDSAMCPLFRAQTDKLLGDKVVGVKVVSDNLTVLFASGHGLVLSGDVFDPDSEGWSLFGDVSIGIGQSVLTGLPYAALPDSLGELLRDQPTWSSSDVE